MNYMRLPLAMVAWFSAIDPCMHGVMPNTCVCDVLFYIAFCKSVKSYDGSSLYQDVLIWACDVLAHAVCRLTRLAIHDFHGEYLCEGYPVVATALRRMQRHKQNG